MQPVRAAALAELDALRAERHRDCRALATRRRSAFAARTSWPAIDSRPVLGSTTAPADQVERPDERGHERRRREVVDVGRRADLLDPALAHDDDPVRQRQRLLLVVGDVHGRDPELALDRADLLAQRDPDLRVERRQRLVEQQDLRLDGERPGQRDALLLAARQLVRVAVALVGQVDQLQELADLASGSSVLRSSCGPSARSRCCRRRSCSGTGRTTGRPSRRCGGSAGCRVMSVAVDDDRARRRVLEAGDHPQGRRLAAAGRAEERDELAALGGKVEVLDRGERRRTASGRRSARGRSSVPHGRGHAQRAASAGAADLDAGPRPAAEEGDQAHRQPGQPEADERDGGRRVRLRCARAATGTARTRRPGRGTGRSCTRRRRSRASGRRRTGAPSAGSGRSPATGSGSSPSPGSGPPRSGSGRPSPRGRCRRPGTCTGTTGRRRPRRGATSLPKSVAVSWSGRLEYVRIRPKTRMTGGMTNGMSVTNSTTGRRRGHLQPDPVGGRDDDQEADDDRDHADDERVEESARELRVGEDLAVGQEDVRPGPDRVEERPDQRQDEVQGAEDEDEPGPWRADPRRRSRRAAAVTGPCARRSRRSVMATGS